ncbi:hypothetical protein BH10BDE1_BH10BDE1_13140 [soil metagenome]
MQKTKVQKTRAALAAFASLASASVLATTTGCAPGFSSSGGTSIAKSIDQAIGCKDFEDAFWKSLGETIEATGRPPSADDVDTAMKRQLKTSTRLSKVSAGSKKRITNLASDLADVINRRTEKGSALQTNEALDADLRRGLWLERVAQLEIGDRTTLEKSQDVDDVQNKIQNLKEIAQAEGLVDIMCAAATPAPPAVTPPATAATTMFDQWKATYAPPVYGGMKTVATIYQSCDAGGKAPIGSETGNVQGISVTGRHTDGSGNIRQVTDLKAYLRTQPYIGTAVYKRPLPSCHDVQAIPSIYDYGGKPYATTADEKTLNMFKNAGTGSKELGIDCSGLVFSAYATAGLKLKKTTGLKASLVNGVSSTMLTQPQANGLTCLDHATFTAKSNLKPGDIIAIKGHVVMVADVGADPFGINRLNSVSQCTSGNISIGNFNFSIFQSDPSKGGIGVNRMRASYYLSSFSTMGRGMIDHAINACKAKFQTAGIVSKSSSASVVRHLGTTACIDSVPVTLTKEECLSSCPARSLD